MTFKKFWLKYRLPVIALFITHVVAATGGAIATTNFLLGLLMLGALAFTGFVYLIVQKLQD